MNRKNKVRIALLVAVVVALLAAVSTVAAAPDLPRVFLAGLTGGQEVPPVETDANGAAIFRPNEDGTALEYKLAVNNLDNTLMAHIHIAPFGENGPVAVWLYPEDGPPPELIEGTFTGILATGTITEEDIVLDGLTFEQLLEDMKNGNAYVNVHTEQFPAGEIRGQILGFGR